MTTQIEQIEINRDEGGGNTELLPRIKQQQNQYQYWCFTLNNYEIEQIEQIEHIFKHCCKWYVFQEETGEKGTPHLQGTICLIKRQRLTELRNINPSIHWENTKSVSGSIAYCQKADTRTGKIFSYNINIPEPLEITEPYGWALDVMEIIKTKPDPRVINWFWEEHGGVGKTELCKYLVVNKDALILSGKASDIFHTIAKFPNKRKLFVVNIPKSSFGYINYSTLEIIKDGLICSGKYEGAQLVYNRPHVIVFANEPPDESKLTSNKRWNIVKIGG